MEIVFEGIVLRPWSEFDAKKLALIADNKNIADNLRDGLHGVVPLNLSSYNQPIIIFRIDHSIDNHRFVDRKSFNY